MRYVFMRFPNFLSKAVTLSYDDGVIYDKKLIEIMDRNGLKGTFNLNSGMFGVKRRMLREEALALYTDSGHEVAVHGKNHLSLAELQPAMICDEILNDRIALEEMFGTVINGMAYAGGSFDDKAVEVLKHCGIDYARTVVSTEKFEIPTDWLRMPTTCHHSNPRLMELARAFAEGAPSIYYWGRTPRLFYLWGHTYEFHDNDNWHIIEEFAEYIGNREDIWYATNGEIYRYVKAYDSLQFSANGERVYNPSAIDVYLNYYDDQFVVPAGATVPLRKPSACEARN
ncbi:MAG: polysaccharide deacetylase family protein [Clostridia bacterium]|nr:polysaccharide deacetylase family protein [Clostridia bacterium]